MLAMTTEDTKVKIILRLGMIEKYKIQEPHVILQMLPMFGNKKKDAGEKRTRGGEAILDESICIRITTNIPEKPMLKYDVDPSTLTIKELKNKISNELLIDLDRLNIEHRKSVCNDEYRLFKFGLKDESILNLVVIDPIMPMEMSAVSVVGSSDIEAGYGSPLPQPPAYHASDTSPPRAPPVISFQNFVILCGFSYEVTSRSDVFFNFIDCGIENKIKLQATATFKTVYNYKFCWPVGTTLKGWISVKAENAYFAVNEDKKSKSFEQVYREWHIDDSTTVIAAFTPELFVKGFYQNRNPHCPVYDQLKGSLSLLSAISNSLETLPLIDFYNGIRTCCREFKVFKELTRGELVQEIDFDAVPIDQRPDKFIKWIIRIERAREMYNCLKHRKFDDTLLSVDAGQVYSKLVQGGRKDVLVTLVAQFITSLLECNEMNPLPVPWTLVLLALVPASTAPNKLIAHFPDDVVPCFIEFSPNLDHLARDNIIATSTNCRTLCRFLTACAPKIVKGSLVQVNDHPFAVGYYWISGRINAVGDEHFDAYIEDVDVYMEEVEADKVRPVLPVSLVVVQKMLLNKLFGSRDVCSVEECAAMNYLLACAEPDDVDMLYNLFSDVKVFRIKSLSEVLISSLAHNTVIPLLDIPALSIFNKKNRVEEFLDHIKDEMVTKKSASGEIYDVIRTLFTRKACPKMFLDMIYSVLPKTMCAGLWGRIHYFLHEDHQGLVDDETLSFDLILHSPSIDRETVRRHILQEHKETLHIQHPKWRRTARLLATLWTKSILVCIDLINNAIPIESLRLIISLVPCEAETFTLALLYNESARELHYQLAKDVKEFPHLKDHVDDNRDADTFSKILTWCQNTDICIDALLDKLTIGNILPSQLLFFEKNMSFVMSLSILRPTFDPACVTLMSRKMGRIRNEWTQLLLAFGEYMPQHPGFLQVSAELKDHILKQINDLEGTEVVLWKSPTIGGDGMRVLASRLQRSQNSFIYKIIWRRHCSENAELPINGTLEQNVAFWRQSIEESFHNWSYSVMAIGSKGLLRAQLLEDVQTIFEDDPVAPEFPNDAAEAQECARKHLADVASYRNERVRLEVEYTFEVLRDITVERGDLYQVLIDFLGAASFAAQAESLCTLARRFSCPIHSADPLISFEKHMIDPTGTIGETVDHYNQIREMYPAAFRIIDRFPKVLLTLLSEGGDEGGDLFLTLLRKFSDNALLNQTIARLNQNADPRGQVLLLAFQETRNALAIESQGRDCFAYLRTNPPHMPSMNVMLEYFATASWCFARMRTLVGGIATLSSLIDGGLDVTTMMTVVEALIEGGEFIIKLPMSTLEAKYAVTALDQQGELRLIEKCVSASDLGDIPFQLCLAGTTIGRTNIQNEVEETNIQSAQQKFLKLIELLSVLTDKLTKLCQAGHPNFHERTLVIQGFIDLTELEQMIAVHNNELFRWHQFLERADLKLPLLTVLSRKQFVEGLKVVGLGGDLSRLSGLLTSLFPNITSAVAFDVVFAVSQRLNEKNNHSRSTDYLSQCIHELLVAGMSKMYAVEVALSHMTRRRLNSFTDKLPPKLKELSANPTNKEEVHIAVIKLRKSDASEHTSLACAVYIQKMGRLPLSIEVFHCYHEVEEQAVLDFARRWTAAHHIGSCAPATAGKLLFCILNAELLKPSLSSSLLTYIHRHRKTTQTPLVILVSAEVDKDSLLCAGLRNDWVIDEPKFSDLAVPICEAFFKVVFPNLVLYKSDTPLCGKSTSVLRDLVCRNDCRGVRPIASIPISGDVDEACELLTAIECTRKEYLQDEGIVLHLNVTNTLNVEKLNRFFMAFLINGVIVDSKGVSVVANRLDTVVIEWPSEGISANHALRKCVLASCIHQANPACRIDLEKIAFEPIDGSPSSLISYPVIESDEEFIIGIKMALAFFRLGTQERILPYRELVDALQIPGPIELYSTIAGVLEAEMKKPPSPELVYRFVRFFSNQLHGVYGLAHYQLCSPSFERSDTADNVTPETHSINYRKLAFYFARSSFRQAIKLAASAVNPLTDDNMDEDVRLDSLTFSFDEWGKYPFVIFSNSGSYPELVSVSGANILNEITADNKDANFKKFLEVNSANLLRQSIQSMCCGLSDVNYDPASDQSSEHPLRRLLPMLGDRPNFGSTIFETLSRLHSDKRPSNLSVDQPIHNLTGRYESALIELRGIRGDGYLTDDDDRTIGDFVDEAKCWLKSITGSYNDQQVPFVLTIDNLVRMLAIKLRLACNVPVVFVGETGCGKTHLISFFSRVSGCLMKIINVHGGMSSKDLMNDIMAIVEKVNGQRVIILLDEMNSMPCVWTIKELVCSSMILGRHIPCNVKFICVMNPWRRRRTAAALHGLDYSPYQTQANSAAAASGNGRLFTGPGLEAERPLVYQVHRAPESILSLVWDFGSPSNSFTSVEDAKLLTHKRTPFPREWTYVSEETLFAESMVHWMVNTYFGDFERGDSGLSVDFSRCDRAENDGKRHYRAFYALCCALIDSSHNFIRKEGFNEISAASLRDISRTVKLIPFLMTMQQRQADCDPTIISSVDFPYFEFLTTALQSSLTLNYALRLNGAMRQNYFIRIREVWNKTRREHEASISNSFLPVRLNEKDIYGAFDSIATRLCGALILDNGIAVNEALKENVMSLFCSIMGSQDTGIAQFIVGRPGSSKSSSLDMLCSSTDPDNTDPRTRFFKLPQWFKISKFVLQCTPDTTARDIERVAHVAASYQRINERTICVLDLEEVGVTAGSRHNPLMVLHGLVDRGVQMEDGTYIRVRIIGISNWWLDASKMNRFLITLRGNPSVSDLVETTKCIIRSQMTHNDSINTSANTEFNASLQRFAEKFNDFVLSADQNASKVLKDIGWFYGMRDFYAFIQMLQVHRSFPLAKEIGQGSQGPTGGLVSPHLVRWALKINFGGHPNKDSEKTLAKKFYECFFPCRDNQAQSAIWARIGPKNTKIYLCDMCTRMAHYTDVKTAPMRILSVADRREVFNAHVNHADQAGTVCNESLTDVNSFPTVSILSYCLNSHTRYQNNNYRIRHVLLFTRANAALRLLRSLNIVRNEEARAPIFGRSDPTAREILDDLLYVRRCMLSGGVLILVGAKHLYESLYDTLNQHYSVEGSGEDRKYYTSLTMNGYTTMFPIHSSFRCIVIEQEAMCEQLLPPFINRFVKAHLNFSSALSLPQRALVQAIKDITTIRVDNAVLNVLVLLIPGLNDDTIDSLAFLFSSDQLTANAHECKNNAIDRLVFMCSPRKVLQLYSGLFEKLSGDRTEEFIRFWRRADCRREHVLKNDIDLLLENFEDVAESPPHLYVTTEQLLRMETMMSAVQEVYPYCVMTQSSPRSLNSITSDKEIALFLNELAQPADVPSFSIAVFDTTYASSNDFSGRLERFMYAVDNKDFGAEKHVVLVVIVPNSSVPSISGASVFTGFQLHLTPKWLYLFQDEIFPSDHQNAGHLSNFLDVENDNLNDLLSPPVFCHLVASSTLSLSQNLASDEVSQADLHMLLQDIFTQPLCPALVAISQCIMSKVVDLLDLTDGKWRRAAIKKVKFTESLRQHLFEFLKRFVERCLLQFATPLFSFHNMFLCHPEATSLDLFVALLSSPCLVLQQNLSSCALVDLPIPPVLWLDTSSHGGSMFINKSDRISFPFSYLLFNILHPIAETFGEDRVQEKLLNEILPGRTLTRDEHMLYVLDILHQKTLKNDDQINAFFSILSAARPDIDTSQLTIWRLHGLLTTYMYSIDAVIRLVTNPVVNLDELVGVTAENLGLKLIAASSSIEYGIFNIGFSADIILITQEESFHLRLYQALAVATSQLQVQQKCEAARFAKGCIGVSHLTELLAAKAPAAVMYAKYLLPVLFSSLVPETEGDTTVRILGGFLAGKGLSFSAPATCFVIRRAIVLWLSGQHVEAVLDIFDNFITENGIDNDSVVFLSRCMFDLCDNVDFTAQAIEKLRLIVNDRFVATTSVLMSGAVTSGLEMICNHMKAELVSIRAGRHAGFDITDDELVILGNSIEAAMSECSPDIIVSSVLFTLRCLTTNGVELDVGKDCIRLNRFLPVAVKNHELMQLFTTPVDTAPSPLLILSPDKIACKTIIDQMLRDKQVHPDKLQQFSRMDYVGAVVAILESVYCVEATLDANDMQTMRILVGRIQTQNTNLIRYVTAICNLSNRPPVIVEMSNDMRHLFISFLVLTFIENTPFFKHLNNIIMSPVRVLPFPPANNNAVVVVNMNRFMFSAAALGNAVQKAVPAVNTNEVKKHVDTILDEILTIKCPSCKLAMHNFPGCFAVTCQCSATFCGWCLGLYPTAHLHAHARTCTENTWGTGYSGTEQQYFEVRRRFQLRALQQLFRGINNDGVKAAVLDATVYAISDVGISVDSLGSSSRYSSIMEQQRVNATINGIKKILFPDAMSDSPAISWMHSLLLLYFRNNNCQVINDAELQSTVEVTYNHVHKLGPAAAIVDDLRTRCQQILGSSSVINSMLAWDNKFNAEINSLSPVQLGLAIPHHFAFRTRFTADLFWRQIANDDRFSILNHLHERANSFEERKSALIIEILNYTGDLMRLCEARQFTRERARNTTLGALATEESDCIGGKRLRSFCAALREIYRAISFYECRSKVQLDESFGALQFDDSIPLIFLLPGDADESLLIPIIFRGRKGEEHEEWHSIGLVHNEMVQTISNQFNVEPLSAEHRTYGLTVHDMILFDEEKDVLDYWSLYYDNLAVLGTTDDIINLQWQVVQSNKVWGKPRIKSYLPEFLFQEDRNKSVFGKLADKLPNISFPRREVQARIMAAATEPRFSQCCMAYLSFMAGEVVSRPAVDIPERLDELVDRVFIPLTEEQNTGRELLSSPAFARELRPEHVIAVSAMIWGGGVIPKAQVPLPDDLRHELHENLDVICEKVEFQAASEYLRLALRLVGLRFLCSDLEEAKLRCSIHIYADIMVPSFAGIDLYDLCPVLGRIELRHFHEVFMLADKKLASVNHEEIMAANEELHIFVVPMSSLGVLFNAENHKTTSNDAPPNTPWTGGSGVIRGSVQPPVNLPAKPSLQPNRSKDSMRWLDEDLLTFDD